MKYNFDKIIERKGTNSVKYDLVKPLFGNEEVLPMWVADMDFAVGDFIIDALKERLEHPIFGYTYRSDSFTGAVSGWMERRHGWKVEPSWIDFSPGVVPALVLAVLGYTEPGDNILVQSPVYFPFFSSIENHDRKIVNNELLLKDGNYYIDFNDLEDKFKKGVKMMLFCHPHNPVGRVWRKEELEKLASLAIKYNVLMLSDEIHSDLLLFGHKHIPLASLNEEIASRTITCVAPSKTFNLAGFHTSAIIISDKKLKKTYEKILEDIHIGGGNFLGTLALEAAYNHGEDWLEQLLKYLEGNYLYTRDFLKEECPALSIIPLEATYLCWLGFHAYNQDDEELMKIMTEKAKLGFNDGLWFGAGGEGFLRMNIATPRQILEEGLQRLSETIQKGYLKKK